MFTRNAGVDGAKFRFDPKGCPWRYPSGTLCLGGFAGYDSLLGGFQIVDQRFLFDGHEESPLNLGSEFSLPQCTLLIARLVPNCGVRRQKTTV